MLLLSTCWAPCVSHAEAQTIQVATASALQAAIEAVPPGGVIELAPGRYAAPERSSEASEGGWHINRKGKSFTIRAAQAGTAILDG